MADNAGKTVREILRGKLGRITKAPLEEGSPSWDDIMDLRWEEIERRSQRGEPGFRTFHKLLMQTRYNKP